MGSKSNKRKLRRMNEKKFVFEWNAEEDTSQDHNPIYSNRHHAQLFGRGHFAGFDLRDQNHDSSFYEKLLKDRRSDYEARLNEYDSFTYYLYNY
jgi:ATP-dependent RNA helicase DDX23/PRP28